MLRFRTLLLWLMVLALPLQGFAAASMLFCGAGASSSSDLVLASPAMAHHAADNSGVQQKHFRHMGMTDASRQSPDVQKHFGATHKCGACAACCSAVWINELPVTAAAEPPPPSDLFEPIVLIQVVTSPLPEKPPRA